MSTHPAASSQKVRILEFHHKTRKELQEVFEQTQDESYAQTPKLGSDVRSLRFSSDGNVFVFTTGKKLCIYNRKKEQEIISFQQVDQLQEREKKQLEVDFDTITAKHLNYQVRLQLTIIWQNYRINQIDQQSAISALDRIIPMLEIQGFAITSKTLFEWLDSIQLKVFYEEEKTMLEYIVEFAV